MPDAGSTATLGMGTRAQRLTDRLFLTHPRATPSTCGIARHTLLSDAPTHTARTSLAPAPRRVRRFLAVSLLGTVVLLSVAAALLHQGVTHERTLRLQRAQAVLALETGLLYIELRRVYSDLLFVAHQDSVRRLLEGDDDAHEKVVEDLALFLAVKQIYGQAYAFNRAGRALAHVTYPNDVATANEPTVGATRGGKPSTSSPAARARPGDGALGSIVPPGATLLAPGEVLASPFDLQMQAAEVVRPLTPIVRFMTVVADRNGNPQGVFTLDYLARELLQNVGQVASGFAGQVLMVNSAGQYIRGPNSDSAWGWRLGHEQTFRREFPAQWQEVATQHNGILESDRGFFAYQRVNVGQRLQAASARGLHGLVAVTDASFLVLSHVPQTTISAHTRRLIWREIPIFATSLCVFLILAWYWAGAVATRERHAVELSQSRLRLRRLSTALLDTQENERRRLSRDLHDDLGQQATAVTLELKAAASTSSDKSSERVLGSAISGMEGIVRTIHELAGQLRPSVLDDLGLEQALETLCADIESRTALRVYRMFNLGTSPVPPKVGEHVYRIVQEALANTLEHGQCTEVWLTTGQSSKQLTVEVRDEGVGFSLDDQKLGTRFGILGMHERVELLGGEFNLLSQPRLGTTLVCKIPLFRRSNDDNISNSDGLGRDLHET
ncbi:MAG: signal transduction histidine kinase [Gammaproteobacteria bacterium]|jgi:signal transduction histidine kinase